MLYGRVGYLTLFLIGGFIYLVFLLIYSIFSIKNYGKYSKFLLVKYGFILIGGKFGNGKTRLMSLLGRTGRKNKKFIISNFYNGDSFLNFSSKKDFMLLVNDLLFLGEMQNFNDEDVKKLYRNYPKERFKEYTTKRKEFKKKYKYIPLNYVCNFILLCDEFHQYFHNREHMSNFSGDNKSFLTSLHQVRHFNTLMILSTQDIEDLDLKFRKLASYEIDTVQFSNLLFGFNIFKYNHKRKEDDKQYSKLNKFGILQLNKYAINIITKRLEKRLNRSFLRRFKKSPFKFKEYQKLDFESKFNVDISISIYNEGDLFTKINEFFKKNKNDDLSFVDIV